MSARATISTATTGHSITIALADATLTNSGSRTAGGLENLGTQTRFSKPPAVLEPEQQEA